MTTLELPPMLDMAGLDPATAAQLSRLRDYLIRLDHQIEQKLNELEETRPK